MAHDKPTDEALLLEILGWWKWDIRTGVLIWSDEIYRILGFNNRKFHPSYETWKDIIHPEDLVRFETAIETCLKGEGRYDCELRIVRPDGQERALHVRGLAVFDEAGNPLRMIGTAQDSTEKKRADLRISELVEHRLRESEDRFRQLTENIGEVFWLAQPDFESTLYASPAYETIWGRSAQRLCTQPGEWLNSIHPEDRDRVLEERRAHKGVACELEYRIVRPDGTIRWIRDLSFPIYDAAGQEIRVAGVAEDITERRRFEQSLRETEEHFRQFAENIGQVVWMATADLKSIIYVNPAYQKIWGRSCQSLYESSVSWTEAIHPDDKERVDKILAHRQLNEPLELTYRIVRPDGALRWIYDRAFPVLDDTGRVIRMAGVAEDVTERNRVEKKLRETEERFRHLTETINAVFWLAEKDPLRTIYVSPAYETIWGHSCESLYGSPRSWIDAIHPEDKGRILEIAANHKIEESLDLNYRIVRPDGTIRWIRNRGFPVHDAAGGVIGVAGVAEDVTERQQLETQLRQAQKMEAIGQLAAGVAHDFNNILTVISGHCELLATGSPSDRSWQDSIAEIRRSTELGSASIQQLLAFGNRQILEPKILDLNAVVTEAKNMLRRLIGEDVCLVTILQPQLSPVRADPGQLHQVLLNLMVNACDAMPQGGRLTLETREVELDAVQVKAYLQLRPGRYVVLTITDTGWGMPVDVQARIFEPFFTNKPEGRGSGLGLSVVLGIVKQSEGYIEVESSPGVGTKFSVYLPATAWPAAIELARRPSSRPVGGCELCS